MNEKEKTLIAGCLRSEKTAWDSFVLQYSNLLALATAHGNRSAAAKMLGLEAKYLFKLIKSLQIE